MSSQREELERVLGEYVSEASELRFAAGSLALGSNVEEMMASLIAARQRLDRVEELLVRVLRVRDRARRGSVAAEAEANDQWDQALHQLNSRPRGLRGEYEGPRERYADANLAVLDFKRQARDAASLVSLAEEGYEALRIMHRGLDGLRQDLVTILRAQQFVNHLEV